MFSKNFLLLDYLSYKRNYFVGKGLSLLDFRKPAMNACAKKKIGEFSGM